MIYPFVSVIRDRKTILSAVLFEADENLTFEDLLYQADSTNVWHMVASGLNGCLKMCTHEEQNVSHIKFIIQNEQSISTTNQVSSTSNIFNEMMNAAAKKVLSNSKLSTNRDDQLYNDVLELLRNKNLELELRADKLEECVLQPWATRTYANYLGMVNQHVQRIQSASVPARSPEKDSILEMRSSCTENTMQEVYFSIVERVKIANEYEIISLEEYLPETKERRFYYLSNFAIDSTV
ncbi:11859_t:CDS:2, partial [Racocetra fulgida]